MRTRFYFLGALMLVGAHTVTADILYSVMNLGTLGGCCSNGNSLNNAGQVVGLSYTAADTPRAFLCSNG